MVEYSDKERIIILRKVIELLARELDPDNYAEKIDYVTEIVETQYDDDKELYTSI